MKKPLYLTLTNDRKVRIAWTEEAEQIFTKLVGKPMHCFADGKATWSELRSFAWCAAVAGEKLDMRELGMDEKELFRLFDADVMNKLAGLCAAMVFPAN